MFLQSYYNNFSKEKFAENLSLERFQSFSDEFNKITSSSSLRNVFDTYLKIYEKEDFEIEIEILFAKIAYQEKRKAQGRTILPDWFARFLRKIYEEKLSKNKDDFKKFLEVFVAYHKYFNPNAK